MGPLELPTTLAHFWIDSSVQMMRATSAFWGGIAGSETVGSPGRSLTSTATPWWKAPETAPTLDPMAWAAVWFPATATQRPSQAANNPFLAAWTPWLPAQAATPATPMEMWQQAWMRNIPQFASFGAALSSPAAVQSLPASWQPVATAYRSANGHAMAAVLRTIADVVEPKRATMDLTSFWLNPLGTRH